MHNKASGIDWAGGVGPEPPGVPETLQQTGLSLGFLSDMILRVLYVRGSMIGLDLCRLLCLPFKVLEEPLVFLRHEKCLDVNGGEIIGRISYRFNLTEQGRHRAQEALKMCAYVGPAPVPLEEYIEQTRCQAVTSIDVSPEALRTAFNHLVVPETLFNAIGPSVISGKSIFIYGPPGNGKSSIAQAIGQFMNNCGGEIYIPYALMAEGSIVTLFDTAIHQSVETDDQHRRYDTERTIRELLNTGTVDRRWVRIKRPVIVTGGELSLSMLDLRYSTDSNYYQAPLHVKANGGIFLIDDFGRQLCSPKELLNRWIMPLENRLDYLTLATGQKFQVPFEQLTIFSTNLDPKQLVDEAFLRRMRHKVEIPAPSRDVYERIFNNHCLKLGMNTNPDAIQYLYDNYYNRGRDPRASDCRDLLETVVSICRFRRVPVQLTKQIIADAAASFIRDFA